MTTEQVSNHLQAEHNKFTRIAVEHTQRLAMKVLKSNSRKVDEFVMCMGTFFFCNKNGDVLHQHEAEELKGFKELDNFVEEWDYMCCITGEPMRFKKDGKITTNW